MAKTRQIESTKFFDGKWRVHTGNLLKEVLNNPGAHVLTKPMQILGATLAEVGERAAILNDPQLNALMCRLTIYSCADPLEPDYDPERVKKILIEAHSGSASSSR